MTQADFTLEGVDIFIVQKKVPMISHPQIQKLEGFEMQTIANRGQKIWPGEESKMSLTDVFQCRYVWKNNGSAEAAVLKLLGALESHGLKWTHVEKLWKSGGKALYSSCE